MHRSSHPTSALASVASRGTVARRASRARRAATSIAAVASLASAVVAAAQQPDASAPDAQSPAPLLERLATQLDMTDAQRAKAAPIVREHEETLRQIAERRANGSLEGLAALKAWRDAQQQLDGRLAAILDPAQRKQLHELREAAREKAVERAGPGAGDAAPGAGAAEP